GRPDPDSEGRVDVAFRIESGDTEPVASDRPRDQDAPIDIASDVGDVIGQRPQAGLDHPSRPEGGVEASVAVVTNEGDFPFDPDNTRALIAIVVAVDGPVDAGRD